MPTTAQYGLRSSFRECRMAHLKGLYLDNRGLQDVSVQGKDSNKRQILWNKHYAQLPERQRYELQMRTELRRDRFWGKCVYRAFYLIMLRLTPTGTYYPELSAV